MGDISIQYEDGLDRIINDNESLVSSNACFSDKDLFKDCDIVMYIFLIYIWSSDTGPGSQLPKPLKFLSAESAKGVFCYVDTETFEKMLKNGSSQVIQGTNLVIRGLKLSIPPIDPLGKGEEKETDKSSEGLGLDSFLINTGRLETAGHLEKA